MRADSPAAGEVGIRLKAQVRLQLLLGVCIVVPILLFAAAAWQDYSGLLREAESDARANATTLREHALKAITAHDILLQDLDRHIQGLSWPQIREIGPSLAAQMRDVRSALPDVASLAIADKDGVLRVSDVQSGPVDGISVAHRDYWQAQRDADMGAYVSRPFVGILTKRLNFAVSRRRTTSDGSFDGTIHAAIDVGYFTRFWADVLRDRAGAVIDLVRNDGEILARFPATEGPLPRLTVASSPFMRHIATHDQSGLYTSVSNVDGVRRIHAFETVGFYPVSVKYGISVASVLTTWWHHMAVLGSVCAVGSAALVLAVLLIMRQMRLLAEEQARRLAVEKAALEGQRLEIIGQLAAGVAHDFANVVQAVGGCATLIEKDAESPQRVTALARTLGKAAAQGQALTGRLLDFARAARDRDDTGEDNSDETTEVADVLSGACALLAQTIGAQYQIVCDVATATLPDRVRGDRGGLEAVIMNLVINARDALPHGGSIVVRAAGEHIGSERQAADGVALKPGLYARISVADSGTGMSPTVLAQAVQPFFTTKPRGRGTGLGLAGAHAFSERFGGGLHIDSEPGCGTTVTVRLPATTNHDQASGQQEGAPMAESAPLLGSTS